MFVGALSSLEIDSEKPNTFTVEIPGDDCKDNRTCGEEPPETIRQILSCE